MKASTGVLWAAFALFVAAALYFDGHDRLFSAAGPLPAGKYAIWTAFGAFLAYSVYCSTRENLFRTISTMASLHWGRQIGIDLYLGLVLSLLVIYLHEGSALIALLWLLPVFAFANLATLLYFAIHYDAIVARFLIP